MALGATPETSAWRNESRFLTAGGAAFLLPGFFLAILRFLLPGHGCVEGQSCPDSIVQWALIIPGIAFAGAIFAAPIVLIDIALWRLLHRRGLCRLWAFCLIGLASGLIWPAALSAGLTLGNAFEFALPFAVAGIATGAGVWLIAYGQRPKSLRSD